MATRFATTAHALAMEDPSAARGDPTPAEPGIVERLRRGDERGLECLVSAHWQPLVRYAERFVGSAGAEDAVQSAFVRLWTRKQTLGVDGSLRALLYTMTRNAAIDAGRRERRLVARAAAAFELAATPPSPVTDAQEAEHARLAAEAVSRLAPRRQEVFRLVREHGLSYRDVAEVMGLSVQTVANHMSLALSSLRKELGPTLVEPATSPRVIDR